jgi:hypothetical protein
MSKFDPRTYPVLRRSVPAWCDGARERIAELEEESRQYFNNEVALRKRIAELEAEVSNLKAIMRGDGGTEKVEVE